MKNRSYIVISLIAVSAVATLFQNCSGVEFSNAPANETSTGVVTTPPVIHKESFRVGTQEVRSKVDVLFVLDESISMGGIISSVSAGFQAIAANAYPTDTLMAVTNMSPAFYNSSHPDDFDPTKSIFSSKLPTITQQPGFLRLVNSSTISSFVQVSSSEIDKRFPIRGCTQSWFRPSDKNADAAPCLSAHTQVARITGAEVGTISLEQLVKVDQRAGRQTFRPGTMVNVIFVSDTHDPGSDYYGKDGAPSAIRSYDALVQSIKSANPQISGLKFHGIVPLPPVRDPLLNGLLTVGALPVDLAHSLLDKEESYGFSYLPFIRKSGGVAMHPVNNNWTAALTEMVKSTAIDLTAVVRLQNAVTKLEILKVMVEGQQLSPQDFTLGPDSRTIEIHPNPAWPTTIAIEITYQ